MMRCSYYLDEKALQSTKIVQVSQMKRNRSDFWPPRSGANNFDVI